MIFNLQHHHAELVFSDVVLGNMVSEICRIGQADCGTVTSCKRVEGCVLAWPVGGFSDISKRHLLFSVLIRVNSRECFYILVSEVRLCC